MIFMNWFESKEKFNEEYINRLLNTLTKKELDELIKFLQIEISKPEIYTDAKLDITKIKTSLVRRKIKEMKE